MKMGMFQFLTWFKSQPPIALLCMISFCLKTTGWKLESIWIPYPWDELESLIGQSQTNLSFGETLLGITHLIHIFLNWPWIVKNLQNGGWSYSMKQGTTKFIKSVKRDRCIRRHTIWIHCNIFFFFGGGVHILLHRNYNSFMGQHCHIYCQK